MASFNVQHTANLARLALTEEEAENFQEQLKFILKYIDQLSEVNIEGVEPMAHPSSSPTPPRVDENRPSLPREAILQNAPDQASNQIRVPKVVESA